MNKIILIGNLTKDPELRTTQAGDAVCTFTIAVNRRKNAQAGQPEADFFRVNVWRQQGENSARYLIKGKKVYVSGQVQCRTYTGQDGQTRASMEVTANEVEFLSPAGNAQQNATQAPKTDAQSGFVQVENDEIPF